MLVAIFCASTLPVLAAEEDGKNNIRWERTEARDGDGNDPICRDYEEVLNTVGESPEKLKCNWTLPPDEKRFQKLLWKPINWKDYWLFLKDKYYQVVRQDIGDKEWPKDEQKIRAAFEKGAFILYMAETDVIYDKQKRHVYIVREERDSCVGYGDASVVNIETKRLDNTFASAFINTSYNSWIGGHQIMLYHGLPFILTWNGLHLEIYSTTMGRRGYSKNICRFQYIKALERVKP